MQDMINVLEKSEISFVNDEWIKDRDSTIWRVKLNNDQYVYQDDDRNNSGPAWTRLQKYCRNNNLHIVEFSLIFRSHVEHLPSNKDGYVFIRAAAGLMGGPTSSFYCVGYLDGNVFKYEKWIVPELIQESCEYRSIDDYKDLLIPKNV